MSVIELFLNLSMPFTCLGCNITGQILCEACQSSLLVELPLTCVRCNKVSPDCRVCGTCRRHIFIQHAWIGAEYTTVLQHIIHMYKFQHSKSLSKTLANIALEVLPQNYQFDAVTYVPTATSRVRQRGYDHAKLIARNVASNRGKPCVSLLSRVDQNRQVGAKRVKRREQLANSFLTVHTSLLRGKRVLLIDDVFTTGATIAACAKELKNAGIASVDALIVAKTI